MQHSESLLTEILSLLQTLNENVHGFQKEIQGIKGQLNDLSTRLENMRAVAFPDGLEARHAAEHKQLTKPSLVRRFFKAIDTALT